MCNVHDDGVTVPVKFDKTQYSKYCMKCKSENAIVVIRAVDPLCRNCFEAYCTHKFRMSFGKNRLVRDGEKVLVAFSGGLSSTAMLHLVQEGKSPRANKKLRFQPSVLYIEEGVIMDRSEEERYHRIHEITSKLKTLGLPYYVYSLEQVMRVNVSNASASSLSTMSSSEESSSISSVTSELKQLSLHRNEAKQLQELFASCTTLTAKENLLHMLREQLMINAAHQTGHTKVLVGDSATRLGIKILSSITQGRGAHLAAQVNFGDCRYGDVTIIRPMREFVAKEVAMYNSMNNLETIVETNLATKVGANASLERLTEQFVAGLQAEYPNTVPTIFRTGEKMDTTDMTSLAEEEFCILCKAHIDTNVSKASALSATMFSQSLSNKNKTSLQGNDATGGQKECPSQGHRSMVQVDQASQCCGQGEGNCKSTPRTCLSRMDFMKQLCYGCRLVIKDMTNFDNLPSSLLEEAACQARRLQMKTSIEEFLLDEGQEEEG